MKIKTYPYSLLFLLTTLIFAPPSYADNNWFVRPYVGLSQMSDVTGNAIGVDALSGKAKVDLDTGFNAGLGIGYNYNKHLAFELAWEYRSNDSKTLIANTNKYDDGNYASSLFFLNGFYAFNIGKSWKPYVGVGLAWAQEVDIDLETNGEEQSYSGDGDFGYQVFTGINYELSKQWILQFEARYTSITSIDLSGEGDFKDGKIDDMDYEPLTAQLGIIYQF